MGVKLTDEYHDEVREWFKKHTDRFAVSLKTVSRQTGLGESTVSQWRNNKYEGDKEKVTRLINDWMERDARMRDAQAEVPYVKTWVAEAMMRMIEATCEMQCMLAMVCPSGTGKTKMLKVAADRRRGFYVYCDGDMTARNFLLSLCRAVFGVPKHATVAGMKEELVSKLRGSNRPIFLDEAHLLHESVFSRIRSIHDQTGCPFIMAGTHKIIERIDDRAGGNGQFFRRCRTWDASEHITSVENPDSPTLGRPLFSRAEIKAFLEHLPVKLDDAGIEMIWSIACLPGYGCLGTVKEILGMCYRKWGENQIGREEIITVLKLFFGGKTQMITKRASDHVDAMRRRKTA